MSRERVGFEKKYASLISLFRKLASEKRYSPIDRLARALNPDLVRTALYDAMRIAVSEGWPLPPQEEVESFLDEIERNPGVAQRLAVLAITAAPIEEQAAERGETRAVGKPVEGQAPPREEGR